MINQLDAFSLRRLFSKYFTISNGYFEATSVEGQTARSPLLN
jgi:hypothetical protein